MAADLPVGAIVVADHQTSGRGRRGRRWQGGPGSGLYVTFVLRPAPLLVFAVGVACAEACRQPNPGGEVRLKWPNDLMLADRKLGGILAEVHLDRALVGIGINLSWAPPGAARLALDRDVVLRRVIPLIETWAAAEPATVLSRWRELSWTLGQRVRAEIGSETIEGLAEDIAEDGALLVDGRRVVAGDVTRLRPAG